MATKSKSKQMPPQFWTWLDQLERDRDLTDSGVATMAGLARSVITKARNEQREIGVESLMKIADALGQPRWVVLQLVGIISERESAPVLDAELAEAWGRLSTTDREEILAMIRVKVKRERAGGSQKAGR